MYNLPLSIICAFSQVLEGVILSEYNYSGQD